MKTQNPWIGRVKGSAGNMTGCKVYDKNVLRAKAFEVSNPNTASQQTQRNFFKQVSGIASTVSEEELRSLFGMKPKAMSRRNMLSKQIAAATAVVDGVKIVDFSKIEAIGNGAKVYSPMIFVQKVSISKGNVSFVYNGPAQISVYDALEGYAAQEGDTLQSIDSGYIQYEDGEWSGTLTSMVPGETYTYIRTAEVSNTWFVGGEAVIPQLSAAQLGLSALGDANVIVVVLDEQNNAIRLVNSDLKWSAQTGLTSVSQFVANTNTAFVYFTCDTKGDDVSSLGFGSFIIKTRAEKI
ncbi:MAG: hypothetical protein J6V49_01735 [Bacteroidales bacterium]|nr:hypothetical protein [Bacteroidales bacterium]